MKLSEARHYHKGILKRIILDIEKGFYYLTVLHNGDNVFSERYISEVDARARYRKPVLGDNYDL